MTTIVTVGYLNAEYNKALNQGRTLQNYDRCYRLFFIAANRKQIIAMIAILAAISCSNKCQAEYLAKQQS